MAFSYNQQLHTITNGLIDNLDDYDATTWEIVAILDDISARPGVERSTVLIISKQVTL